MTMAQTTTKQETMSRDLANRSPDIHWPEGFVVTDEVGMGSSAAHLRQSDESLMHRGHDLWLATLKWMAEGK